MADCTACGEKFKLLGARFGPDGDLCGSCFNKLDYNALVDLTNQRLGISAQRAQDRLERDASIDAILLTTETAPNLNITRRIEIVTAECAFGMNIFKDLFAGVRDIVGGRSEAVQKTMRDSRRTALYELKREAYEVGANAVVGVDLDYVELSS
nr:heavy metal-binding domain-containing protein [Roseobacter sp.]